MEKLWLKSYPPGIPAEINPDAYESLVEVFKTSCQRYHNSPAFYNLGVTLTFQQLESYSRDFAAYLQQVLKLRKGDRFAIMLPNILQYPVVLFGALQAGLTVVNINPLYKSDELIHQLNDSGSEAIIVLTNFAATLEQALPRLKTLKHIIVTQISDLFPPIKAWFVNFYLKYILKKIAQWNIPSAIQFKQAIATGKNCPLSDIQLTNQDIAFLQYTGGTTGIAKGAILTHRNLIANIQQADAWFKGHLKDGEEIIITALPLYHIFSLTANCLYFLKVGGLNVLITNPRDVPAMVKEIKKFKFTAITGVNTLFNALLNNRDFTQLDFSSLHLALGGGMAIQEIVADKWQKLTSVPILEAYGLTETSPCVTINPTNIERFNGSIGLPVSSTNVCILNDAYQELPLGEPGELAVKGPQVMKAYWNNPEETQKVFNTEGWLLTGDIATIDVKGFVRIVERKKDMIIVSGFNVYPNEIEAILARMPGVKEVAVIGVPNEHSGEVPKAYIVKSAPYLTEEAVIQYARERLTSYKVPKEVAFVTDLPKTNVGKILRRALKEDA